MKLKIRQENHQSLTISRKTLFAISCANIMLSYFSPQQIGMLIPKTLGSLLKTIIQRNEHLHCIIRYVNTLGSPEKM